MNNTVFSLLLAIKKNIDNPPKDLKESIDTSAVVAELKTPEDQPQIKVNKSPENEKNVSIPNIIFKDKLKITKSYKMSNHQV